MDVLSSSEKAIKDCYGTEEKIKSFTSTSEERVDFAFRQKIQILEFFFQELTSEKTRLSRDISDIIALVDRTKQMINSLQYPEETNRKCVEIRSKIPELKNDDVQKELRTEIQLIETTRVFLNDLLSELREQLRKHKKVTFDVENEIRQKSIALKEEKQNESLKVCSEEGHEGQNELAMHSIQLHSYAEPTYISIEGNWQNVKWVRSTRNLLSQGKRELKNAQKLIRLAEESLSNKTTALIFQFNRCNEAFHNRIAQCKGLKSDLETELLNLNEVAHRVRLCVDDTKSEIAINNLREKKCTTRLHERQGSKCPELLNDRVQLILTENMIRDASIMHEWQKKLKMAQTSLTSLMKVKNRDESEVEKKISAIQVDEVECLPSRSSIHYHEF